MPIDDDIQDAYPDNWTEIRETVLDRATGADVVEFPPGSAYSQHRMAVTEDDWLEVIDDTPICEWCGKPNGWNVLSYSDHWEADFTAPREDANGQKWVAVISVDNSGTVTRIQDLAVESTEVVLTVAHLCQDPRCDKLEHLRALCQRCHLGYDRQPEQKQKRKRIQSEIRGQQSIVDPAGCEHVLEEVRRGG